MKNRAHMTKLVIVISPFNLDESIKLEQKILSIYKNPVYNKFFRIDRDSFSGFMIDWNDWYGISANVSSAKASSLRNFIEDYFMGEEDRLIEYQDMDNWWYLDIDENGESIFNGIYRFKSDLDNKISITVGGLLEFNLFDKSIDTGIIRTIDTFNKDSIEEIKKDIEFLKFNNSIKDDFFEVLSILKKRLYDKN